MDSLSSSLILLIVALVLLWLAVTDRLQRVIDAAGVLRGTSTTTTTSNNAPSAVGQVSQLVMPSLPKNGTNAQVPA